MVENKQFSIRLQKADYIQVKKAAILEKRSLNNFIAYAATLYADKVNSKKLEEKND